MMQPLIMRVLNLTKLSKIFLVLLVPITLYAQSFESPSEVQNVTATAQDQAVELTWDQATDADGVVVRYKVYYGVTPVTQEGGNYDQEIDTQSDDTTFTVNNLVNGDTYYFGVTAVDEQGNESELYSVEVSATPIDGGSFASGDNGSPILQRAEHSAPNQILVVMSEPVRLANPREEAFELMADATGNQIPILNAVLNSEQITLYVDPASLEVDEDYLVTATTGVTDFDDNPVSSGIVDSVQFTALEVFAPKPVEEPIEEEPAEEEELLLEDEPPIEEETPPPATPDDFGTFFLDDNDTGSETADFLDELLAPENPINNLEEEALNPVDLNSEIPVTPPDQVEVEATSQNMRAAATDETPPQEARELSADTSNFQSGSVSVSWKPALDIDDDIKDQVLYTRVGLGSWDNGLSLGKDISQTTIEVQPNQNYQIRLVTVDEAGNESFGAAFDFSTTLSQSGSDSGTVIILTLIALVGFLMLFAGGRRS